MAHIHADNRPFDMVHCAHRTKAQYMGRKLVAAMKDKLGKQLFEVIIQASANGDIVARETIKVLAVILLWLYKQHNHSWLLCYICLPPAVPAVYSICTASVRKSENALIEVSFEELFARIPTSQMHKSSTEG